MHSKTRGRAAVVTLLLIGLPATLCAQSDDDANGAVQFNFSNPGARSLALGGAFVGAADDATAAYTNPAGLFQLSAPEVSIEGRQWSYTTPFADRGRFSGTVTGIGVDTIAGVQLGQTDDELSGISYASFVHPKPKWAFALFYHQVANFEANFETGGVFTESSRLLAVRSTYDLDISQVGVAFAFKWGKGAAGLGVSNYSFDLASTTQRFGGFFFGSPDFSSPSNFQRQTGESDEIGYTVGIQIESSPKTRIGLVYRFGPEFDVNILSAFGTPEVPGRVGTDQDTVLDLPDVIALGFSFQPRQNLTVNLDFSAVLYSQLVGTEDEDQLFVVIFEGQDPPFARAEDFKIDDATEIRLGVEYVFDKIKTPIALRGGAWWDPDHRLRYEGSRELTRTRLFEGDDELHVTAGLGLVFGSRFQLDAAVDLSDNFDVFSLSTVVRF